MLQKIEVALPNNSACNNWLQGGGTNKGTSGLTEIQQLLQASAFGHGTVSINNGRTVDYDTWAFSGVVNPDNTLVSGIPANPPIALTVNDVAGFFNSNYPNLPGYNGAPYLLGPESYQGNTLRAQAMTLVHEVAHQITVSGFQDDNGDKKAGRANNKAVDTNCRQLIEGLQ